MTDGQPMTLAEHIDDIRKKLNAGGFSNEAAVSQGVVLKLLHALNWPVFDAHAVRPEYTVEGRRVDFALFPPESDPLVFMEVKNVGKIEGAEEQLFSYAFHEGVPIAVLTDGREWRFFYPTGEGNYRKRRVRKLNIVQDSIEEIADHLARYLRYESVCDRRAIDAIKEDYRYLVRQRQIAKHLPDAWKKLIEDEDEFLLVALSEKTESLCGHNPTDEQMLTFLSCLKTTPISGIERLKRKHGQKRKKQKPPTRLVVKMPDGEIIDHKDAIDTFVETIDRIGIEQVKSLGIEVRRHPLIATTAPSASHKDRSITYKSCREYYIFSFTTTKMKTEILEKIAAKLGESIQVEIVEK